jgi:tetratricopeptide (TPR) repeat protein
MVEYAGLLADLYVVAQKPAEAEKQLAMVDLQARMEAASGQKANRQIALIYANHHRRLKEALEVAEADLAHRKDVFTWDAYSWVLYRLGRIDDAAKASRQALRTGTQDALLLYHAGAIAHAQGDKARARDFLQQALHLNPNFAPREAPQASALLKGLGHDATAE